MNCVHTLAYPCTHTQACTPECFQCVRENAVALGRELVRCPVEKESFLFVWSFAGNPLVRLAPALKVLRPKQCMFQALVFPLVRLCARSNNRNLMTVAAAACELRSPPCVDASNAFRVTMTLCLQIPVFL